MRQIMHEYLAMDIETKKCMVIYGFTFEDAKSKYCLDDKWINITKSLWCPM